MSPREQAAAIWPHMDFERLVRILEELDRANGFHEKLAAERGSLAREVDRLKAKTAP